MERGCGEEVTILFFIHFFFIRPNPGYVDVPGLGVESELWLLA